ncbi:MAG TPA: hypothetical protein V6C72_07790, partial [Chroococcales cyanobacterium]
APIFSIEPMTNADATISLSLAKRHSQPWLSSAVWDGTLIVAPALASSAIALIFRDTLNGSDSLPVWAWVSFILLVDVAHVYATGFRTYFNRQALQNHLALLVGAPLACWLMGCLLYSANELYFWRVLAYLAVFHFIRQQYGFMMLYSRKDPISFAGYKWLDGAAIYAATLYPLLYWHTHMPRNFNWFIEGDFVETLPAFFGTAGLLAYAIVAVAYIARELISCRASGFFNIPKNLIVISTAVSWWVGIIALNSDIAFTMTNVLSHGIPYMALVWLYHSRSATTSPSPSSPRYNRLIKAALTYVPLFVGLLWMLAYLEEGLWDGLVWHEHTSIFLPFSFLPAISDKALLSIVVPLLALPQSTHYVLDGFIWRIKDKTSIWTA